jgi:uncharacterized LabA/DUF88 family protein
MATYIYVDGFNLYYRALRGTPYKWLDLDQLSRRLLPKDSIAAIKYYTALVQPRPHDPQQAVRQGVYLRALQTIPHLSIIYGHFLTGTVTAVEAGSTPGQPRFVRVLKTEEKGSDVNLASHLLFDGFQKSYDTAIVVTNDSDLAEPIRIVREELGLKVGILSPSKHPNPLLVKAASFFKPIRTGVLRDSQFSHQLTDSKGNFSKPVSW